jgi:polyhydroxybutyrate depolymerase
MRLLLLLLLAGCAAPAPADDDDDATEPPGEPVTWPQTLGIDAGRGASIEGPEGWDQSDALPLVILLHGFYNGMNGETQELLFRYRRQIESQRFLYVLPTGTENSDGEVFWNGTDACCDFEQEGVDDSAYLRGLVDEAIDRFHVDPDRVYFSGHSNGGYMSYRMACDHADAVAAIAGLAGATWLDEGRCGASEPVSVLHIHGDADSTVEYGGDEYSPGAIESAQRWATRAGCGARQEGVSRLDLVNSAEGDETRRDVFPDCADGEHVELWTMEGLGHLPLINEDFGAEVIGWLLEQRR